jgi:hypothetical protein
VAIMDHGRLHLGQGLVWRWRHQGRRGPGPHNSRSHITRVRWTLMHPLPSAGGQPRQRAAFRLLRARGPDRTAAMSGNGLRAAGGVAKKSAKKVAKGFSGARSFRRRPPPPPLSHRRRSRPPHKPTFSHYTLPYPHPNITLTPIHAQASSSTSPRGSTSSRTRSLSPRSSTRRA